MRVYAYLRASTKEQDALRAKETLLEFAQYLKVKVSAWFVENESGAKLNRPELFRLLNTTEPGDVLLIEQIDRITRLSEEDWHKLKSMILDKRIRVISLDLPTSHNLANADDEFQRWILSSVNSMMLDILAATARKDYTDRRRRQADGVAKAKILGKYKGRPEDIELHNKIQSLLDVRKSYSEIQFLLGCSRHTISKVKNKKSKTY
ncbi:recombinase family protein [Elizabethkingia anophelis]|uniref:recombinase family protein n=1 Tax=Elizabethkingia anophelis TaxID=1117645 RepID=UPI000D03F30B|nr:recombinase family protein [Elizabethkingia anophelis]MCL1689411.1 recombinase family protein [Elizabethkingia anophelis]MDV4009460.1 resolvase [Elizabethkingia anophelis]MYY49936.1 resolvase [Elizabethkingia anophelis]PRQ84643.1 resolvase [Elizabethkingia anophelis]PRQ85853.1 resolvase [Elizabethkingia anophelis]